MHSTRGRARLLFEMLQDSPLRGGWRNEEVKAALDLCLGCKGCKSECPVNVDMATYKAEFLSHYYEGRLRPRNAYAFGLMYRWAALASRAPRLVNAITQTPGLRHLVAWLAAMAPQRRIPMFAPETFRAWFRRHAPRHPGRDPVLLWVDTWNDHFHPRTAQAAVEVLEDAGFHVVIPPVRLCCGRPLYDYGMLGLAKKLLGEVLETLRPQIRAGVPVVGLEPSCVSVFRDELVGLLHGDEDARRLKNQTFLFTEFFARKAPEYRPPRLARQALVHQHCHHKAVLDAASTAHVLDTLGLEYHMLDSGCCGMAGAFGFECGDHYDVSIEAGERILLPAVRKAEPEALIVADGFSCREQIAQRTSRQALHPAQVMKMALDDRYAGRHDAYPEQRYMADLRAEQRRAVAVGTALTAMLFAATAVAAVTGRRGHAR